MSTNYSNEPLLDMYIFETEQLLGQLEQLILDSEKQTVSPERQLMRYSV